MDRTCMCGQGVAWIVSSAVCVPPLTPPTPPPCHRGPLKDKTVVLVTNALQYLPFANNILWIDGGVIRAQGGYREQLKQGECVGGFRAGMWRGATGSS